jgi:diaminopimelate decarboxylase
MKQPFITKSQIESVIEQIPTPFHIYNAEGIRETARNLRAAFAWNKGYREFFAVKALPTPAVLRLLAEEGCGMDCATLTELELCRRTGITGKNIMFSSNCTPDADFLAARNMNVLINLDDFTHIDALDKLCGLPDIISCRYNSGGAFVIPSDDPKQNVMDSPQDAKYGFTEDQLIEGYKILKAKGVKHFGIHAFLASNTQNEEYYPVLAGMLFELAVRIKSETGIGVDFINLSGGVGIPYLPEGKPNDIFVIGEGVRRHFERIMIPAGLGDVSIFTELGRFVTGPQGLLITKVIRQKHIYKKYIGVDASACDLMRPAIYRAYHHITVFGKEDLPNDHVYDVTGGLCENNDKFAVDRALPEIEIGDILAIHDTGAHGRSMGYNYNGKLRCAEVLFEADGSFRMIRRAETAEDYFATISDYFD